jgi:hypothetical protein
MFNLEATYTEIITDFKEMNCDTQKELGTPESGSKKRRNKKTDQVALNGVLGLASLISDRDLQAERVPDDWFQQYPLMSRGSWDLLPTGIPFQGKELLTDSFSIYYSDRQSMSQD